MIRLRFTRDAGFNPWLVRTYTWCDWDHVEFVTTDGKFLGARPNGGVQIRDRRYKGPIAECFGVVYSDPDATKKVTEFLYSQIDKPYDWSAIYGIAAHRDWRQQDRWICSELIAAACEPTTIRLFNGDKVNRFSPRDLYINALVHLEE